MSEREDILIWQFVDGTLADGDHLFVSQKIRDDQEWQMQYQEVLEVHQQLEQLTWQKPSIDFTDKVMAKVEMAKANVEPIDAKSIWARTYLAAQVLLFILVLYRMRSSFLVPSEQNIGGNIFSETVQIIQQPICYTQH